MATTRWRDVKHKISPERRAELRKEAIAEYEALELTLRGVREHLGMTQVEVAEIIDQSQGQVSETERREDLLLSTLRRYIEALGGELEVSAIFGAKRIVLQVFERAPVGGRRSR